jgi:hypothetical protein
MKKIKHPSQLQVGDIIRILKQLIGWSSHLHKMCPIKTLAITYPHELVIKSIKKCDTYTAMTCGNYGWSLESIIEAGCVKIAHVCNYNEHEILIKML